MSAELEKLKTDSTQSVDNFDPNLSARERRKLEKLFRCALSGDGCENERGQELPLE